MPPDPVHLRINRMVGSPLEIANADRLAEAFFSLDRSSVGTDAYDAYTAHTPVGMADLDRINGPMRARSKRETWDDLFEVQRLEWLAEISTQWHLFDA